MCTQVGAGIRRARLGDAGPSFVLLVRRATRPASVSPGLLTPALYPYAAGGNLAYGLLCCRLWFDAGILPASEFGRVLLGELSRRRYDAGI